MEEEWFFDPLLCAMADGVAVGHPISVIHMAHVIIIIDHNLQLYGLCISLADSDFCGEVVYVCHHINVMFVPPQCWHQVIHCS